MANKVYVEPTTDRATIDAAGRLSVRLLDYLEAHGATSEVRMLAVAHMVATLDSIDNGAWTACKITAETEMKNWLDK